MFVAQLRSLRRAHLQRAGTHHQHGRADHREIIEELVRDDDRRRGELADDAAADDHGGDRARAFLEVVLYRRDALVHRLRTIRPMHRWKDAGRLLGALARAFRFCLCGARDIIRRHEECCEPRVDDSVPALALYFATAAAERRTLLLHADHRHALAGRKNDDAAAGGTIRFHIS